MLRLHHLLRLQLHGCLNHGRLVSISTLSRLCSSLQAVHLPIGEEEDVEVDDLYELIGGDQHQHDEDEEGEEFCLAWTPLLHPMCP